MYNHYMNANSTPRCPEYNEALENLRTTCNNDSLLYGFQGVDFEDVVERVNTLTDDMLAIFEAKDTDYASNGKPMGNLRSSEELGIPAWKGTLLRMGDKKQRIMSFAARNEFKVKDEQIADTLKDLGNYACLNLVLFDEAFPEKNELMVRNSFIMLAVKAIHCKLLSEYAEEHGNLIADWREQPLHELLGLFDNIAGFARTHD